MRWTDSVTVFFEVLFVKFMFSIVGMNTCSKRAEDVVDVETVEEIGEIDTPHAARPYSAPQFLVPHTTSTLEHHFHTGQSTIPREPLPSVRHSPRTLLSKRNALLHPHHNSIHVIILHRRSRRRRRFIHHNLHFFRRRLLPPPNPSLPQTKEQTYMYIHTHKHYPFRSQPFPQPSRASTPSINSSNTKRQYSHQPMSTRSPVPDSGGKNTKQTLPHFSFRGIFLFSG